MGTMELASSMLYAAVSNADNSTQKSLFVQLKKRYDKIIELATKSKRTAPYYILCKNNIDKLFTGNSRKPKSEVKDAVKYVMENGYLNDSALEHYQFYPANYFADGDLSENSFIYQCLLQAVRLVALFHDVGHPPYSHIIESVIKKLYIKFSPIEGNSEWQKEQLNDFRDCLREYMTSDPNEAYVCQTLLSNLSHVDSAFHERVGLSLFESAISDIVPELINSLLESRNEEISRNIKIAKTIYYITVVEFAVAMLAEDDILFQSFHRIVDGDIDADRLDYIMRDSLNSGVDWGKIPYKRIINSAKLVYPEKYNGQKLREEQRPFVIAYPRKVSDDIEDILLIRYKIYARINYHHKCMRTSLALQSAVMELAEDYLSAQSEDECINPDIRILWSALSSDVGDRNARVIQWNDSWLISVLHKAYTKIKRKSRDWDDSDITQLQKNLEEVILNKKRSYTLLKRGSDAKRFMGKIIQYSGITAEKVKKLELREEFKLEENKPVDADESTLLKAPGFDARDSLSRIKQMRKALESGEVEFLCRPFPLLDNSVEEIMDAVLSKYVKEGKIVEYRIEVNENKGKTGLPKHSDPLHEIYMYDRDQIVLFDDKTTLRDQIESIEKTILGYYIYFVPAANTVDAEALGEQILEESAFEIAVGVEGRYNELFEAESKNN